ncbi:MAG: NAD-dependent epimerase/dehydratase family protein, partial [Oscillospiraceae bacterium]|nr:NAD-dependent epimerase/dehydratase family protein [Oscillospiraceae bacterium]
MWLETPVFREDLECFAAQKQIPWQQLRGKTVFLTGGTGLIGSTLVSGLLYANQVHGLDLTVVLLVRNIERAKAQFAAQLGDSNALQMVEGTVEHLPALSMPIDYLIHGASPTASTYFVEHPVETIFTAVNGTENLLKLAQEKGVKGFIYLSSMEMYGTVRTEQPLSEEDVGYLNPLVVRNCYPESKRMCEAMCAAYASEYGLNAKSVRLAQTFGPGVAADDRRVFAEFGRCAVNRQDIILQTEGKSKHCYVYTMDAASGILTALLLGEPGRTYNVANPATYSSIREMADMVARELADGEIGVKIAATEESRRKYPADHFLNLQSDALNALGWTPTVGLA